LAEPGFAAALDSRSAIDGLPPDGPVSNTGFLLAQPLDKTRLLPVQKLYANSGEHAAHGAQIPIGVV
jgi:hypothetical protein